MVLFTNFAEGSARITFNLNWAFACENIISKSITKCSLQLFVSTLHRSRPPAKFLPHSPNSFRRYFNVKVAPYSFMIAHALKTKAQVICTRSKENVNVFEYFMTPTWAQEAKPTVNFLAFPSVKFRKTWQTDSKYFTLVGTRFTGKSIGPVFSQR